MRQFDPSTDSLAARFAAEAPAVEAPAEAPAAPEPSGAPADDLTDPPADDSAPGAPGAPEGGSDGGE
jgi:hypothetical protein